MAKPAFPLRFEGEAIKQVLDEVSGQTGVSKNRLIQDAVAVHLNFATRVLEERMESALDNLRAYRGKWSEQEIAAFARAEVDEPDPVEGRMIVERETDPFASVARFAETVE